MRTLLSNLLVALAFSAAVVFAQCPVTVPGQGAPAGTAAALSCG
jgi:hypothetical protein